MQKRHFVSIIMLLLFGIVAACSITGEEKNYSAELLKSDIFWAEPAVIKDCLGVVGKTTLRWNAPGVRKIEIHVDSADGTLFTISGNNGSKETGYWVKDGMKFVLVDAEAEKELATISVKVLCGS